MKLSRFAFVLATIVLAVLFAACNGKGAPSSGSNPPPPPPKTGPQYTPVACSYSGGCIDCDQWIGKSTCQLSVTFLTQMPETHKPVRVYRKTRLLWVGDHGEILTVSDLTGTDCGDDHHPDPKAPKAPTENLQFNGSDFVFASVRDDQKLEKYCYKHNISYTDGSGKHTIDPHIYVDGGP